jgi:cell wall-associated NlpC family hydrolase
MRDARRRIHATPARLIAAALLAVSLSVGSVTISAAAPSRQDVADAQAKLDELNNRLEILTEQYNEATTKLRRVEDRLAEVQAFANQSKAEADAAQARLSARVISVYTGVGSELEILLGASSLSEFSDRLTFLSNLVGADSDVATEATVKRQAANRAAADLAVAVRERQSLVDTLNQKKSNILNGIQQQRALVAQLKDQLSAAEAAAKRAAERKAALLAAAQRSSFGSGSGGGYYSPPPGVSPGAAAAVAAAYSVLGVPYAWGGASPSTGFDCSGLTMWSWAHGGVSLPHSSEMQYAVLPHISRSDLQPGDLVFFYYPIHHVAIYVGNDLMIHAPHEGSVVSLTSLSGYPDYAGAARP